MSARTLALLLLLAAQGCGEPAPERPAEPQAQPVARLSPDKRAVHASAELRACARELVDEATAARPGRPVRLAVYRVSKRGRPDHVGEWLATTLTTHLAREGLGRCELFTRRKLSRVLEEWKLQATGLVDPATLCRAGKLSGVDGVIVGEVDGDDREVRLNLEVVDTETAGVLASARTTIPLDRVTPDAPLLEREAAIGRLATELGQGLAAGLVVACYDVTRAGERWTGFGADVARGVEGRLAEDKRLKTVDREHLATLLEEQEVARTLGDEEAQARTAKLVGAQVIVVGAGASFERHHEVDLTTIDVESARILSASRALILRPLAGRRP